MKRNAARSKNGLVAALDIGSTKVCCLIARLEKGERPRIIGIGQQASTGVKAGSIVDMEATESAVLNAVHAAEQMAGESVERVIINLSGGYPASASLGLELEINGHEINDADLRRAVDEGQELQYLHAEEDPSRQLIHLIPVSYSIDGSRGVRDPRGMFGEQLGVNMHLITAAKGAVRNLVGCVRRCDLDVTGVVVSPYASGLASLVEDERELGVTVIDLGGGTTTIAVFFEGNVIYTDVIPIGGQHVTSDIARGLSTTIAHAERLKTLYGHAMVMAGDERDIIAVPQVGEDDDAEPQQLPRSLLIGIIQPRMEETFEMVRAHLEQGGFDRIAGRRVVLTGGGAQLQGVKELAAVILDKQVRIGRPLGFPGLAEATGGPAYATTAGLLSYAVVADTAAPPEGRPRKKDSGDGLMDRLGSWLREHF